MGAYSGPHKTSDALALVIDAGNTKSYPGSGTTINDLSGNNYNSSIVGATFNINGYLSFPGTGERDSAPVGEYVTLNTNATTTDPSLKPNGVTYEVWMRFTGNQLTGHGVFYGATTINHIEFRGSNITSGYWRTEAVTQNGYSFGGGSTNADGGHSLGEWFNLTLVFANNESGRPVRWYRDGNLFHTGNMTSGNNPAGEYFRPNAFGRSTGTDTYQYVESFKGDMGLLNVYNRTLSESEVKQNYNATKGRFGI